MFVKRISEFACVFNIVNPMSQLTGLKEKGFLSFERALSTKKKLAQRKLTFWEYVFGPKRSSKNPYQPVNYQKQRRCEENSRYQTTPGDVLVYTHPVKSAKNSRRLVEPLPKPPPSYKPPKAVLLNRTMVEGFAEVAKSIQFCHTLLSIRFPRSESH